MWRIRFWPKFFFSGSPSQIFLKRQKKRQIVSKQVKTGQNRSKIIFFKSCTFRHLFSVPHSICCYFLATPATYFAKMAKKSKFHCIWLIFRKIALDQGKKSSATSKMSPMGSFRMFPHHITWKADFWKLSRKPHLEYSHSLLNEFLCHCRLLLVEKNANFVSTFSNNISVKVLNQNLNITLWKPHQSTIMFT